MDLLLDWSAPGWRYRIGAQGHTPGFEAPAFDDSGWSTGAAPFGHNAGSGCSIMVTNPPATSWSGNQTDLLVRRTLTLPSPGDYRVRLRGAVDDALIAFYWHGVQKVGPVSPGACATRGDVDAEFDAAASTNEVVIAVRARDTGGFDKYWDCRLDGEGRGGWHVGAVAI